MLSNSYKHFKSKTKDERQDEISSILKSLENGVRDVFDSDNYKKYLAFCGKFHNYSFNNSLLILMQFPHAQKCASYATWKSLKMPVKRGEKGIKILYPVPYSYVKKYEQNEIDQENEAINKSLVINGLRFRVGHVFDISQVLGTMPSLANELTDNPDYLNDVIDKLVKNSPTPVIFDQNLKKEDCNGYYDINARIIALRTNMSSLQTIKTLIHEVAHSLMHVNNELFTRYEEEVQAESTAFVVCSALGLDTSEYSFEYVASWSSSMEVKELKTSLTIIETASKEILSWIEGLDLD